MEQPDVFRSFLWTTAVLAVAAVLCGCPPLQREPVQPLPERTDGETVGDEPKSETDAEPEPQPQTEPPEDKPVQEGTEETSKEVAEETPEEVPETTPEEAPEETPEEVPEETPEQGTEKGPDLGPPLVDNLDGLRKLDPVKPVWLDPDNKRVVLVGQVCQTEAPLELFACLRNTKEHEAVVTVDVEAFKVHAGLMAAGAEPGHPVKFDPYVAAEGSEIEVTVVWKDDTGTRKSARAQDWVRNAQTRKSMEHNWVFGGSGFWEDEQTGKKHYNAEGGDLICVSNFASAMLDLPIESSKANTALMFEAFTERIPPRGTAVTLVLSPKLEKSE